MNKYQLALEIILNEIIEEFSWLSLEKEYQFAKSIGRKWRADYALINKVVVDPDILIEYEGLPGFSRKSRHTTRSGYSNDLEKYNKAAELGCIVLRYSMVQLESPEEVKRQIKTVIENLL